MTSLESAPGLPTPTGEPARFTLDLLRDVAAVLAAHGYPPPTGRDLARLRDALVNLLYPPCFPFAEQAPVEPAPVHWCCGVTETGWSAPCAGQDGRSTRITIAVTCPTCRAYLAGDDLAAVATAAQLAAALARP